MLTRALMKRFQSHWLIKNTFNCFLLQLTLNVPFNYKSMYGKYFVFNVTFIVCSESQFLNS